LGELLGEFIRTIHILVHVALDEFQEIVTLKDASKIEALMRTHVQRHRASCFFIGSRRRVLLGTFNQQQRPFLQSAINYQLKRLPREELVVFLADQFRAGRKLCSERASQTLAGLTASHPYYSQKLAFFVYEAGEEATEEAVHQGLDMLIKSEKPVFEAILQGLSSHQRLLLRALAREPTKKLLASAYLRTHHLGSVGGVQHSARHLEELDLIERDEDGEYWRIVDPILALWLKHQEEERI
jgi:hypothetical protein